MHEEAWLEWNLGAIAKLVRLIYDEKDFQSMPKLAELLEQAGCVLSNSDAICSGTIVANSDQSEREGLDHRWKQFVLGASERDILFLPYQFDDHYVRCLRGTIKGKDCQLSRGFTRNDAGYNLDAKNISHFVRSVTTFELEPPEPWTTTREAFATTIERIIALL